MKSAKITPETIAAKFMPGLCLRHNKCRSNSQTKT